MKTTFSFNWGSWLFRQFFTLVRNSVTKAKSNVRDFSLAWKFLKEEVTENINQIKRAFGMLKNFIKANKEIKLWAKQLSIFDFIQVGDMILSDDEDDDEED